jgi:hypothetical protein
VLVLIHCLQLHSTGVACQHAHHSNLFDDGCRKHKETRGGSSSGSNGSVSNRVDGRVSPGTGKAITSVPDALFVAVAGGLDC